MLLNSIRSIESELPLFSENRNPISDSLKIYEYPPKLEIKITDAQKSRHLETLNSPGIENTSNVGNKHSVTKNRHRFSMGSEDIRRFGLEESFQRSFRGEPDNSEDPGSIDTIDDILDLIWPSESTKSRTSTFSECLSPSSTIKDSHRFSFGAYYSTKSSPCYEIKKSTSMNNLVGGHFGASDQEIVKKTKSNFEFGSDTPQETEISPSMEYNIYSQTNSKVSLSDPSTPTDGNEGQFFGPAYTLKDPISATLYEFNRKIMETPVSESVIGRQFPVLPKCLLSPVISKTYGHPIQREDRIKMIRGLAERAIARHKIQQSIYSK
ncbi:hypothetical protein AYI68_g4172 [Smittium mucronatum]|uniref:Uncharacterized protein n=1 Tax=Smittium mucronatum TaxID=133383 RepID=A0A1R0GXV6_9FUNG|nr:hypothetical protein AYI68_g4172 [Smittium mucronatum]